MEVSYGTYISPVKQEPGSYLRRDHKRKLTALFEDRQEQNTVKRSEDTRKLRNVVQKVTHSPVKDFPIPITPKEDPKPVTAISLINCKLDAFPIFLNSGYAAVSNNYFCTRTYLSGQHYARFFNIKTKERINDIPLSEGCRYGTFKMHNDHTFYYVGKMNVDLITLEKGCQSFNFDQHINIAQIFDNTLIVTTNCEGFDELHVISLAENADPAVRVRLKKSYGGYSPLYLTKEQIILGQLKYCEKYRNSYFLSAINLQTLTENLLPEEFKSPMKAFENSSKLNFLSTLSDYLIAGTEEGILLSKIGSDALQLIPCGAFDDQTKCCLDGRLLLIGRENTIQIWDVESGDLLDSIHTSYSILNLFTANRQIVFLAPQDEYSASVHIIDEIKPEYHKLMTCITYKVL